MSLPFYFYEKGLTLKLGVIAHHVFPNTCSLRGKQNKTDATCQQTHAFSRGQEKHIALLFQSMIYLFFLLNLRNEDIAYITETTKIL